MELITDRTESDVLLGNKKGVYGIEDLNRVESAVRELVSLFSSLDINLSLDTKTDWALPGDFSISQWPVESQMNRYLENIAAIKNAFSLSVQLPASMNRLTWVYANNIEKILQQAFDRSWNIIQSFRYSGEFFAGEE